MRSAVKEDLLYTCICQKLEGIFDKGCVGERQKTLVIWFVIPPVLCIENRSQGTYPRLFAGEGLESRLECVGEDLAVSKMSKPSAIPA
jgi:hypothetical protein